MTENILAKLFEHNNWGWDTCTLLNFQKRIKIEITK